MINRIDHPEMTQYSHKVLNQYVKKDHLRTAMIEHKAKVSERFASNEQMIMANTNNLRTTMIEHATKVNERFASNEQMIMANTNKFNELLIRHELAMINKLDEKTNHVFWKFTKLSLAMMTTGLIGGAGAVVFILDRIDNVRLEVDTKIDNLRLEVKADINKLDTKINELDKKLDILLMRSNK
jgi:hypothetical protein